VLAAIKSSKLLDSYESSRKMLALKDILNELGFEEYNEEDSNSSQSNYLENKNKILIFSRYKETLDILVRLFLSKLFPGLKYLRIDASVPSHKRFELVQKFNSDLKFKLLLLTTNVGGVGLNLHTANVVIMFDHDYNPMNDLQAIDRAHRIGQKNTLMVYRLIMKDTLEEQIMGIQRFKVNVAHAVVNLENSSIENVKNSNLLSLFSTVKPKEETKAQEKPKGAPQDRYKKILDDLEDLWEESQYTKEY